MSSQKEAFQDLLQYVFDKEALEARDRLHASIVEMVMYIKDKPLDRKTIKNEIKNQLGLDFEQSVIDEAINTLLSNAFIKEVKEKGCYFVEFSRKKKLNEIIRERRAILISLESKFVSTIKKLAERLTPDQERYALEIFYQFCVKLFASNSNLLIGILQCTEKDIELIKNYEPAESILQETMSSISDDKIKTVFFKTVIEVLDDDNILQLLAEIARNYLYFRILNLDPICKSLQKDILSKKVLMVDTNFIMSLVLPNRSAHKAAFQCVSLCQKLGVELRFTQRTVQEYFDQLSQSEERFKKLHVRKLGILVALDDDFIAEYGVELQKRGHLDWSDFVRKLRLIKNILAKYKISEYSKIEADLDVASLDSKGSVKDWVIKCAAQAGNIKNDRVAQHDSYHLLLIRKLRETVDRSNSLLGPSFWFLTFDRSLLCADKAINDILCRPRDLPSSIECWALTEMMMPFVSGSVLGATSHEAFSQLMRTEFRVLPTKISTKKLIDIQTSKINLDNYTAEEVKTIVDDEFVTKYRNEVMGARFTKSENLIQKAEQKLEKRVVEVATSISERKPKTEHVSQIIAGVIAVFMAIAAVYSFLVQHYFEGGLVLSIFALVFMAISFGYKQIEIAYKELKLRFKK